AKPKKMAVPIAKQAVKDRYKVVIAMGGDNTIEAVIRGITGSKARLGIIPAGTENNLALSLGIPEDPQKACALIVNGQTLKLDIGEIKIKGKKFNFFEVVTIGLAAAIYPDIKEIPKGNLSRIKDAVLTILNHATKPKVSIELDGERKIVVETMLMTVTNIPYIGLKFLVAPDASMHDGLLDIAVYPEFSKAELLTYFGKVMNEGRAADGKIQRYRAHKLKVKTSPVVAGG
ncbi:MAG TPA: diacylglycerol kinase family protein, partial [Anaerolineaceae bacterium]